jgi:hypothetical protein
LNPQIGSLGELPNTVKEEVLILPNEIMKITKTLQPAFGVLNIVSKPAGAEIFLNDNHIGKTPIYDLSLPAVAKFKIRLEHPKAFTQIFEDLNVDKNVTRTDTFDLRLKPGRLQLLVDIEPDKIFFDGQRIETNQKILEKSSGVYQLQIIKDGFDDYNEMVSIEPEETITRKITLLKTPEKSESLINFSDLMDRSYLQGKFIYSASSSFAAESKRGISNIQSEISLGHVDYLGFFAFTGNSFMTEDTKSLLEIGDISEMKQNGVGVWVLNHCNDLSSGLIQLGLFKSYIKARHVTSKPSFLSNVFSVPIDYESTGVIFNYSVLANQSITFDFRIGGENIKAQKNSTLKLKNSFFLSIGIGIDLIDIFK